MLNGQMPAQEWSYNFRMSYASFMKLADILRPYITPNEQSFRRDTISVEKRLALVLYYLKDQGSLRMTANSFGVSTATVSISSKVCGAICEHLGPLFMKFPFSKDEMKAAASKFELKFQILQVIGCVDSTHIAIKMPTENPHDYFCYKMKYSLNCQAICDENGLFINVEVRWPGSVHDARVYSNCQVNKMFQSKELPIVYQKLLPGCAPVPPLLLGDPAYPLLPNVLIEYSSPKCNKEIIFNNCLRSGRNQIECAFGRLKARWRIFNRVVDVETSFATTLTYSCFVLHNYCEINDFEISPEAIQSHLIVEKRSQCCEHHEKFDKLYSYNSARRKRIRDVVAEYLYQQHC